MDTLTKHSAPSFCFPQIINLKPYRKQIAQFLHKNLFLLYDNVKQLDTNHLNLCKSDNSFKQLIKCYHFSMVIPNSHTHMGKIQIDRK